MNQFTHVGLHVPGSNNFSLNHPTRTTADGGRLFPVLVQECLPGDVWRYNNSCLTRLSPLVTPVMHDIDVSFQAFFVANRLVWPNWEAFMENPVPDENSPVAPYLTNVQVPVGSLPDYIGLPTNTCYDESTGSVFNQHDGIEECSALPFAAYQKIFSDWYQPVNLGTKTKFTPLTDGDNTSQVNVLTSLKQRGWQHDYFTAASIAPQAGQPVVVPLGDNAPVVLNGTNNFGRVVQPDGTNLPPADLPLNKTGDAIFGADNGGMIFNAKYDPNGTLMADLSAATGMDVETLRWSITLQQFLERNNLGGTRYIEQNLIHWGVKSSDARLQRAELVGSSTTPIVISEVLQNAPATEAESTPQGNMAGHGLGYGRNHFRPYFCEEHGFFIVLACIRPKTSYSQGLSRMWTRKVPLDYPFPEFAGLGEQAIKARELYYAADADDSDDWGYQPRYSEYRYIPSNITGEFRTTLAPWTMSRMFTQRPLLNRAFVDCSPTERIFAVMGDSSHSYLLQINHKINLSRKLPKYGIPGVASV